jgi:bifunctional UDP-N-acetylglucosamine pyrophosphorylase/glucosamine-1-phosphate N-acetyltransferase
MRSARPKVLHTLIGRPMIAHVLAATEGASATSAVVVLGHGAETVRASLPAGTLTVVQEPQLGTGHAVRVALDALDALDGLRADIGAPTTGDAHIDAMDAHGADMALILYGDMPLLRSETLRALLDLHGAGRGRRPLTLLSALTPDPFGYGRIVRDAVGHVAGVKEQKELAPDEEAIGEINVGVYCADLAWLRRAVRALPAHPDGEYYLPDLVPLALAEGGAEVLRLDRVAGAEAEEAQGVNTRVQLAAAETVLRGRVNQAHMLSGVTIVDPATTYIEPHVAIGQDTTILPNTYLRGATRIGAGCAIGPDTELTDSVVGDGAQIVRSVVEDARVGSRCHVGPYAHLRHGAVLLEGAQIGNYAEVKNSTIGAGSVSHHVSYIGDTTMGERVNVGAGTVTANYDGARKHHTTIGDGVFVGVGTLLRAPLTLGNGSRTGAGAVVLRDVAPGVTVAGVPARPLGE